MTIEKQLNITFENLNLLKDKYKLIKEVFGKKKFYV